MKKLLELFVKKQKDNLTATEQQTLDHLQADEQTREEWARYQQIWEHTGQYQAKGFRPNTDARWAQMQQHMHLHKTTPVRRARLRPELRIAATILLVLFAGLAVRHLWQMSEGPILQTVETTEQLRLINLPDGTQVRLHPGSSLTYPEDLGQWHTREVSLEGAGYFSVATVPGSTFRVYTLQAQIEVLGTRFLVDEPNAQQTVVEVEEGKVAFHPEGRADTLILTAANRVIMRQGAPPIKETFTLQEISTPPQIWKARGNTLSEFKEALADQSGEQVIFPPAMADCTLAGNLDLSSQYRLLEALRLLGYDASLNANHQLVIEGGCP